MPVTINGTTGINTPGVVNTAAETVATTLAVTGATTLASTLAVTGATTLASTLAVTGATTLTGNVTLGTALLATPTGSAPIYGIRAWVSFDGTGTISTNQTIRGNGNVTSVFKNGTGDYTVTFTTALPNVNYATVCGQMSQAANNSNILDEKNTSEAPTLKTTTQVRLQLRAGSENSSAADGPYLYAMFIC